MQIAMSRDGGLDFPFDQDMIVPDFTDGTNSTKNDNSTRRALVAMKQIDVQRDLLDIKFIIKSDVDPKDIKYYLSIKHWTPRSLAISINFTDPTMISKGEQRDVMYMKLKDPFMFRSAETGLAMDMSSLLIKKTIPRQLPPNVNRKTIENVAV